MCQLAPGLRRSSKDPPAAAIAVAPASVARPVRTPPTRRPAATAAAVEDIDDASDDGSWSEENEPGKLGFWPCELVRFDAAGGD